MKAVASLILLMVMLAPHGLGQVRKHFPHRRQDFMGYPTSMGVKSSSRIDEPLSNVPASFQSQLRRSFGPFYSIRVRGNYAYCGVGQYLDLLDIANPPRPSVEGRVKFNLEITDVWIRDSLVYTLTDGGIWVARISSPSGQLQIISYLAIGGVPLRVVVDSTFAYVTTFTGLLRVIDVSDPAHPYFRGWMLLSERLICLAVKYPYVYAASLEDIPLYLINVSDPDHLSKSDQPFGGYWGTISVDDTLLMVSLNTYFGGNEFRTYSISNPGSPVLLGDLPLGTSVDDGYTFITAIARSGTTVYLAGLDPAFFTVDISDPSHPVVLDSIHTSIRYDHEAIAISVSTNHTLYTAYYSQVSIVDASNPNDLKDLGAYRPGLYSNRVTLFHDSIATVAAGSFGMWTVDPATTFEISDVFGVGAFTTDMVFTQDQSTAFLVNSVLADGDTARGIRTINMNDPSNPQVIDRYDGIIHVTEGSFLPNAIKRLGSLLFLTQAGSISRDTVLEVIDASAPASLSRLGLLRSPHRVYDLDVKDSTMYLATTDGGIRIVDASNPGNPVEVGSRFSPQLVGVAVLGDYLYVNTPDSFFVCSLSPNPRNPSVIGRLGRVNPVPVSSHYSMSVSGGMCYWSDSLVGVVDVSDPYHPVELLVTAGLGNVRGIASKGGDSLYTIDPLDGFAMWKFNRSVLSNENISSGWNLLSLPRQPADPSKSNLYPSASSRAFAYQGSYQGKDTLLFGEGYWLKFDSAQSVSLSGDAVYKDTIPVSKGWNIVGSLTLPVPVSTIESIPPGMSTSLFYGYAGIEYQIADTIHDGQGYWVKAGEDGMLILSSVGSTTSQARIQIAATSTEKPPPPPADIGHRTSDIPQDFSLEQNYPNPFNPVTLIRYQLPVTSKVRLVVFDLLGHEVRTLVDGTREAGYESVEWNCTNNTGSSLASGVYFYRLEAVSVSNPGRTFAQVKKLVIVR